MAVCQNLVPLVNINIAGKWMFIPLKMVLIGIDPYPYIYIYIYIHINSLHLYGVYMCFNIEKWLCRQNTCQDTLQAKTGCEYSQ